MEETPWMSILGLPDTSCWGPKLHILFFEMAPCYFTKGETHAIILQYTNFLDKIWSQKNIVGPKFV